MKITIVGQYYWPDNFLVNEIAEEMVKRGHSVTMLTGLPDYATNHVPKEYRWFRKRHEIRNGVDIIRVPIIARHTGFMFRVLNYLSFFTTSSLYALTHPLNCDVLMAYQTAPVLMGNAAIILKKKLKKKLLFYCLDIWPDQMKIWHVNEGNPLFKIVHQYCKYAYGNADLVGITSEPFREYMIDINQVDPRKIVYLPQHALRIKIEGERKPDSKVNLIFAGNIGKQQNVECILKAVPMIKAERPYMIHIYGNGTSYDECQKLAEKLNILDYVTFYGRVPKETLKEIYPQMDAFLLTLCPSSKMGFAANTVPAKFQGYLSTGKPIIASIDGGAREIIEKTGCGVAVSADDSKEFARVITDFINNKEKYAGCGERGMEYFNKYYDKEVVMDQIEKILEGLAGRDIERATG